MIRMRKECPEIAWGDFTVLRTNVREVLALRYDWRGTSVVTLHNFSNRTQTATLRVGCANDKLLVEVFDGRHSRANGDGEHRIRFEPYAWRWFRVGSADNALHRTDLNLKDSRIK
jgi:maltose alpha-D-glucosyltransferase/alpha-amylase